MTRQPDPLLGRGGRLERGEGGVLGIVACGAGPVAGLPHGVGQPRCADAAQHSHSGGDALRRRRPPLAYRPSPARRPAPKAAARMASTGAGSPVQSSKAMAAWCTSIPRPSTVPQPGGPGGGEQRGLERVVHEVGHDLAGAERSRVERQPAAAAHADRGGVHDEVGVAESPWPPRPTPPAQRGGRLRLGRGAVDDGDRRPRRPAPAPARPPGPPRRRRARSSAAPAGSKPASRERSARSPAPSVFSPRSRPSPTARRSSRRRGARHRRCARRRRRRRRPCAAW